MADPILPPGRTTDKDHTFSGWHLFAILIGGSLVGITGLQLLVEAIRAL